MNKTFIIACFFLFLSSISFSQDLIKEDEIDIIRHKVMSGGIQLQSTGLIAFNFRRGKQKTVDKIQFFEIEIANLQHPKEFSDPRFSFIFKPGKINTVWTARLGYGSEMEITEKLFGGVSVHYVIIGGASLALVKPIYVYVKHNHTHTPAEEHELAKELYNPREHLVPNVEKKGSYFEGMSLAKWQPGIFLKNGLNFEFSPYKAQTRAIEIGVLADYYFKEVPIMSDISNDNSNLFLGFYVNFLWGKKW